MPVDPEADRLFHARLGIELCREGRWSQGFTYLVAVGGGHAEPALPGLFYSYLGYTMALCQQRLEEGLELCRRAVQMESGEPEVHLNLARLHLLAGRRRAAVRALAAGLAVDPHHGGLRELERRLGRRRPPVLRFLRRRHPLNRVLGRLRALFE